MHKNLLSLVGMTSSEDRTGGFASLLLLAGLSITAATLIYSASTRSQNVTSLLESNRYRNSRDAIANSLRDTVSMPALLNNPMADPNSDLQSCLNTSLPDHCIAKDASGNSIKHDIKVVDTIGRQLSGTASSPIYYDANSGGLCDPLSSAHCELQATSWFTIDCGGAASCRGKPEATLSLTFKVEQDGVPLPNGVSLKSVAEASSNPVTLGAVQANVLLPSTAPGDPNLVYTQVSDPVTKSNLPIYVPATGSKVCNDMKALGNPAIVYDPPRTTNGSPGVQYTGITKDLYAADETITDISNIVGNVNAVANVITQVSNVNAPSGSTNMNLNAPTVGNVSNIVGGHSSITAHTLGSVSNITGSLYVNTDSINQISNVTTNEYFTVTNRGWISAGTTATNPISFSNIHAGNFQLCGFNVSDISNIAASFIGITNGSILTNGSNFQIGQLTIYGGTVSKLSNSTGNITFYGTSVGTLSNINGNVDLYNGATLGSYTSVTGKVTFH